MDNGNRDIGPSPAVSSPNDDIVTEEVQVDFPLVDQFNNVGVVSTPVEPVKKKTEKESSGSIFQLFSFANVWDWLLMAVGLLAAVLHGAVLPASMFVFGEMLNLYIFQNLTAEIWSTLNGNTFLPNSQDPNCSIVMTFVDNVTSSMNLPPALTNIDYECRTESEFFAVLLYYVYGFLGLGVGSFLLGFIQVSTFSLAAKLQVHRIRKILYRAILRQNIAWFDENKAGELNSRLVDDLIKVQDGIGDKLSIFFQLSSTFFAAFIIGFAIEWRLTLLMLGCTPFLAVAAFIFTKLLSLFTSKEQKEYAVAGSVAEEVLSSIRTVQAFGGEQREHDRYCKQLKNAKVFGAKKGLLSGVSIGVIYLVIFSVYALALWFSAFLIGRGFTAPGDTLTVFFALLIGAFSIGQAGPTVQEVGTAIGAMGFIYYTIHRAPPIDIQSDKGEIPDQVDGKVEFKKVHFSYPSRPDVVVLNDLNLEANVGQTLALVGPSGCGKSTVIQLLQRFYDVDRGSVLVDGRDVKLLNLKWLRSQIGVVSQEPVLFATTIAENIRYGREGVTQQEIESAAHAANAHDFIMSLPNQYQTLVGERGTQMSGGQKQRIAIARALVRDPKILLLDEATSALDAESEGIVQDALDRARQGRTTIVIAHRLSTIRNADKIAVFCDGEVAETGNHESLMKEEGLYYTLVTAQTGGDLQDELEAFAVSPTKVKHIGVEIDDVFPPGFERQSSHQSGIGRHGSQKINRQGSQLERHQSVKTGEEKEDVPEKKDLSDKELEEFDKDLQQVGLLEILKVNAKEWPFIALGILGSFIEGIGFPLFAIFFGEVLTVFTSNDPESEVALWSGLLFLLGVVSGIGIFIKTFSFTIAGEFLTARLRERVFKSMLRQDMEFFDNKFNTTGALTTRLANDAAQVQGATGARLGVLFQVAFALLLSVGIAFGYSWSLTLIVLGFIPILMVAGGLQVKAITGFTQKNKKDLEEAGKLSVESIGNIRTVASLGKEMTFYELYCEQVNAIHKRSLIGPALAGFMYGISQGMLFLGLVLVFGYGGWQVTRPTDHIAFAPFGRVFVVFNALIFGAQGAGQASAFAPNYAKARVSANRIFAMIRRAPKIDVYSEEGEKGLEVLGNVEVKNVKFTYPSRPDVTVLKGLSVDVQQGKTLALVGPSGCGKSTVVSLIERFYDPDSTKQENVGEPGKRLETQISIDNPIVQYSEETNNPPGNSVVPNPAVSNNIEQPVCEGVDGGKVCLDQKNLRSLNLKWLRQQIGIVSQEPVLFDASIAENIRYGALFRNVSDEEVEVAAKAANIHDFILGLPMGYDTNVGSRGTQMSGGQKQRIAIARALVRDPKILLLDEATSALDAESEGIVQDALDRACQGRTTIVIAHRLSTIRNADKIAVFCDGKVAERGNHESLMKEEGIYYTLVTAQTGGDLQDELEAFAVTPMKVNVFPPTFERQSSRQSGIGHKVVPDRQESQLERQQSAKAGEEKDPEPEKKDLSEKELEEFDKDLKQVGLLEILKVNAREWPFIALGILGSFIEGIGFPLFAIFFGEVLTVFASNDPESEVALWSGLLFLLGVVSGIGIFIKTFSFTIAGEFLTARLRERMFKSMLRQDMEFFDNKFNTTGALTTRLANDAAQVQGATGARLGVLFQVAFALLLSVAIAFAYSWSLTLIVLGFIPILMVAGGLQLKAITGFTQKNKKDLEEAGKLSVESIGNIRTVASLGKEMTFYELYCEQVNAIHKRSLIGPALAGFMYGISQGMLFLGLVLVFGYGGWQVTRPTDHVAFAPFSKVFVVFNALIFGAQGAGQASAFAPNYAKARVSANRIFAMIRRAPNIDVYSEEGEKGLEVLGNVEVKNVKFTYPSRPDVTVLKGLSVDVQQGKTLALVGPSGCGKSTVVSLIERFYDPDSAKQDNVGEPGKRLETQISVDNPIVQYAEEPNSLKQPIIEELFDGGKVCLDQKDLRSLNLKWLRQQIGIVSQEPVLFDASIAENIRYGALFRNVSDEEVEEAAKAANIHDFILGLPMGYDTNVGSRGTQMSGGQKQRIAIARALVRDPKILLLDEATSALDAESEGIVQDALDRASQGRTTIIIAHRLSTIQNADTIAVIKGGKVAEKGTHSELLKNGGIYYKLNRAQLIKK